MDVSLRLALVTDIHAGPDTGNVRGEEALGLLETFVLEANRLAPDLAVDLGDRLTDVDEPTDRARLAEVAARLKALACPREHLLGNHDTLPREEQEAALGGRLGNRALDLGGWRLLFLDTFEAGSIGGRVTPEAAGRLSASLEGVERAVVFSHQPLHGEPMAGNPYFEQKYAAHACPQGAELARAVLERSGRVRLCVSGHAHWNDVRTVNGVPYLSVQGLTESWASGGRAAGAWAWLELGETIRVRVKGLDPFEGEFGG